MRIFPNHRGTVDTKKASDRAEIKALTDQISALVRPWGDRHSLAGIPVDGIVNELYRHLAVIERAEADERAEALLAKHLNREQRATWKRSKYIRVQGQTMTYRVTPSETWIDDGPNRGIYLCAAPAVAGLPLADRVLATKLMIEGAEEQFLGIANPNSRNAFHFRPDGTRTREAPLPFPAEFQRAYDAQFRLAEANRRANEANQRLNEANQQLNETVDEARRRATGYWTYDAFGNITTWPITTTTTTTTATTPVDVPAFGDTNRTYITGPVTWTEED